ncbi:MAG: magnesium/cobalt transporter CorA [Anaerolineales bacterium]
MIRSLYYVPGQTIQKDLPPEKFPELIQNQESVLWVDFISEPPEICQPILEAFGFHPLAIDDALRETHVPRLDDWSEYLYIVFNYMNMELKGESWETQVDELDILLGKNYIITHHDLQVSAVDETWIVCNRDERNVREGADHILYRIADNLMADYMPAVEKIDDAIDQIENEVFQRPSPHILERLLSIKRVLVAMRRIIVPQREVLNKLARDDYMAIDRKDRVFFRDVYDHAVRLHDLNESQRDLATSVLDTYLSVINNRMNEVMKTLTTITVLFMPLTFLTGYFGMNFFEPLGNLRAWTTTPVFYLTLAVIFTLPFVMYFWFRRRTWV